LVGRLVGQSVDWSATATAALPPCFLLRCCRP
jgi:hypothetical protein